MVDFLFLGFGIDFLKEQVSGHGILLMLYLNTYD